MGPCFRRDDEGGGHQALGDRAAFYAASTVRLAPSACTIFTRLPAGVSGPATRQTVSSIRTVPEPSTIGFSSVNSRPIIASVRLLRKGLLTLWLEALRAK